MTIFDLAAGFVAYSILLFMFLFVCYAWAIFIGYTYQFLTDEVIPFIKHFLKPTKETDD